MTIRIPAAVGPLVYPNRNNNYTICDPAHLRVEQQGQSVVIVVAREDGSAQEIVLVPLAASRLLFALGETLRPLRIEA